MRARLRKNNSHETWILEFTFIYRGLARRLPELIVLRGIEDSPGISEFRYDLVQFR
jgi:hypothetical protein